MPPHTISPIPGSQGLGISFSTLSPPPVQDDRQNRQQVSFTGMGVMPRPQAESPNRGPGPSAQPPTTQTRAPPPRALPPTSTSGAPLYQAGISLRPTHTRGGSKGFNTFSALPPHQNASQSQTASRPQASSSSSSHRRQQSSSSGRGFIPRDDISVESETIYSHGDEEQQPLRRPSVASNGTTGSRHSSRRNKSVDFLRSLSKSGEETLGGGAYVPISEGHESLATMDQNPARGPSPSRNSTVTSTIATGAITNNGSFGGPTPSDTLHSFHPGSFPLANPIPEGPPSYDVSASRQRPLARGMSRSKSTPMNLQPVPEALEKRISDPSTGMHSRNRALLDAEAGGMMLAFSPGGEYRAGQPIFGPGSALMQTPASNGASKISSAEEIAEESLQSRPWSTSTMSHHPNNSFGHRARSLSDGAAMLARQGTLFHPGSSKQRSSAELNLMLGQPKSRRLSGTRILPPPEQEGWKMAGGGTDDVRLEAAKKKKARVEVDVVLERECVVEGGEIKGRLEVRINGGKRGEGLRVAGGKVRVVGFEDISANQRHIFYHQPHALSVFDENSNSPIPSLFASGSDEEGYRLAAEGTHSIPFRMRIPLNAGAKGSFSSPGNKGPCVRYVVVGSVKLYIPSTMKRSIAHFYRSIVILPYLNPSVVLAPSLDPIESVIEGGLGWSLGGEKGKVEMRIGLGRRTWVAGQRVWCEVGVRNSSSKKIKNVTIALLQTVTTFTPDSGLDTGDFASRLRRRSAGLVLSKDGLATPEMDACQTSTVRRKIAEEYMEADSTGPGEGRVTGKSWWTGVEAGERDHWDMSLLIPNGLITIRRTRLIEVTYAVRVTVNGSIYTDVPVNLINFLSIDPPPMPGDGARLRASAPVQSHVPVAGPAPGHLQPTRMASANSLNSSGIPARASSTTLHIDALLQAGRARAEAEAEAQGQGTEGVKTGQGRPQSMGSEYTLPHARSLADLLALDPPPLPEMGGQHRRPPVQTLDSYQSDQSDQTHEVSEEGTQETRDQLLVQKRQKMGRQTSLALAISQAEQQALEAMEQLDMEDESRLGHQAFSQGHNNSQLGHFKPDGTPFEREVYEMGHMPPVPEMASRYQDGARLSVKNGTPKDNEDEEDDDDTIEADHTLGADDTVLLDLVRDQLPEIRSSSPLDLTMSNTEEYNYAPEANNADFNPRSPVQEQDDSLRRRFADLDPYAGMTQEQMAMQSRTRYDSIAVSEVESEVGQVVGAVKRNLSVRLPARLVSSDGGDHDSRPNNHSMSSLHPEPRLENAARQPSPLRNVQQLPTMEGSRPRQFLNNGQLYAPTGPSPRTLPQDQMPIQEGSGSDRSPSHLGRHMSVDSRYKPAEDDSPGLAPSVASDSASSEGHLESPPHSAVPIDVSTIPTTESTRKLSTPTKGSLDTAQSWMQGEQGNTQVYLQNQATYSARRLPETPKAAPLDTLSSDTHSMPGSPQTVESMLPSVRTKIEQLNTREEALRKFSVTGALSPSTPRASISSNPRTSITVDPRQSIISTSVPLVTSPVSTSGRYTPRPLSPSSPSTYAPAPLISDQSPSKRRSYTAALGPRATRTISNDSEASRHSRNTSTHKVGNTTYLTKKSFAQSRHISPIVGTVTSPSTYTDSTITSPTYSYQTSFEARERDGKPERTLSMSSTSTSATSIEAALMRRPGGPRGPVSPAKKGSFRQDQRYVNMASMTGRDYGHVTEEDDSEGLM